MAAELGFQPITDPDQIAKLKAKAEEISAEAREQVNSADGWKLKKESSQGILLHTKKVKKEGKECRKLLKIQGRVKVSCQTMKDYYFGEKGWGEIAVWSDFVKESRYLQNLGDGVVIKYQVTRPVGPGDAVSARDFVLLGKEGTYFGESIYVCHSSVELDNCPTVKSVVRAAILPSCIKVDPSPSGEADECQITMLFNLDLKLLGIPELVFKQIYKMLTFSNFKAFRDHVSKR